MFNTKTTGRFEGSFQGRSGTRHGATFGSPCSVGSFVASVHSFVAMPQEHVAEIGSFKGEEDPRHHPSGTASPELPRDKRPGPSGVVVRIRIDFWGSPSWQSQDVTRCLGMSGHHPRSLTRWVLPPRPPRRELDRCRHGTADVGVRGISGVTWCLDFQGPVFQIPYLNPPFDR